MAASSILAHPSARAFTLVEMIVVLAIIGLITAIVLTSNSTFDNAYTITDTAYTIALSIREAQAFGISSRGISGVPNAAYGIHYDASMPGRYIMFADTYPAAPGLTTDPTDCPGHPSGSTPNIKPGNCTYDAGSDQVVQTYTFNRGFTISQICGHDLNSNTLRCTGGSSPWMSTVDILYLRPNTDSIISVTHSGSQQSLKDAQITLSSRNGGTRQICVTSVGEISVTLGTCP